MRRLIWGAVMLAVAGCSPPTPLGVYRLPIQTGPESLELRTLLVRQEGDTLVLRDALDDQELARATAATSWLGEPMPYEFGSLNGFPFTLYLRDGVLEDVVARPWATQPMPPIVEGRTSITLARLTSAAGEMSLFKAGELLFSAKEVDPPASDAVPDPLVVLGSVSGAGLVLRPDASDGAEWRDAVSAQVPHAPEMKLACGRTLRSLYRSAPGARVSVPAGSFDAVHVTEIVDVCPGSLEEPTVWKVERWYVPGVGPVRLLATLSDGRAREYRLVETNASGKGQSLWPLEPGTWWQWTVIAPDGTVVDDAAEVRVGAVEERTFPL